MSETNLFFSLLGISPYGFFLLLSIVLYVVFTIALSCNYHKKYDQNDYYDLVSPKQTLLAVFLMVVFGFYGARLGHFILSPWAYKDGIHLFFALVPEGLVSWGSFLGLFIVPVFVKYVFKRSALRALDMFFFFIPLQIAVRRFGCLFAGCCVGHTTDNALAKLLPHFSHDIATHPFPLYIIMLCVPVFAFLVFWARRKHQAGTVFTWFFILYSSFRFFAEFFRGEDVLSTGLNKAQTVCVLLLPVVMLLHIYFRKSKIKNCLI